MPDSDGGRSFSLQVQLQAIDVEPGTVIANAIGGIAQALGSFGADLSAIDQVILSCDFAAALGTIDLGDGRRLPPNSYTNEDYGQAVAKVIPVSRSGEPRVIIVFNAGPLAGFLETDEESEPRGQACFLVTHEFLHVHDADVRRAEAVNQPMSTYDMVEQTFWQLAETVWGEYYATRVPASLAPAYGRALAVNLHERLDAAPAEVNAAIRTYRLDRDINKVMVAIQRNYGYVLKLMGHVLGFLDGLGCAVADLSPDLATALPQSPLGAIWQPMGEVLRALFDVHGNWNSPSALQPAMDLLQTFLRQQGIEFSTGSGGLMVRFHG